MEEAIRKADALIEALSYIQQFAGKPVVIKFGGNAMEDPDVVDGVVEDAVFLATVGIHTVIVHGGGPRVSRAMREAGLAPRFVRGLRVTDAETLEVVVRVLAREVAGEICRRIEAHGGRAHPAFRDGRSPLRARKKSAAVTDEAGGRQEVDLGFVGDVVSVDADAILSPARDGAVVVVPPIAQDEAGQLYNVNADTAAAAVAAGIGAEKVVFMTNVHGILADPDDPDSLLSTLREDEARALIGREVITSGMLPKIEACIAALDGGVAKAHIIDGTLPHSLLLEIFTDKGIGTQILKGGAPKPR